MRLTGQSDVHLTYCTNVHPGESLGEVEQALRSHVAPVRRALGVKRFGVGLRLAARAAEQLDHPDALRSFKALLDELGLYVFTLNGFPFGAFHNQRVKEHVYEPDWRSEERLQYSNRLARLLAQLLPSGMNGSISTVPLGFRNTVGSNDEPKLVANLLRHVAFLHELREQSGCTLTLALEPEPHCRLETLAEAVDFLERGPFGAAGVQDLARETGLSPGQAEQSLRRQLGVCLDACHMTVEYEEPASTLSQLTSRGIAIAKLQISAGLRCELTGKASLDEPLLSELSTFADDVYLHQVVERRGAQLFRYLDLPEAFRAYRADDDGAPREWRVHFHVPVFMNTLGRFSSTRTDLQQLLALQRQKPFSSHLEVETYTWQVLPEAVRPASLSEALVNELSWTLSELGQPPTPTTESS
jgi:sugar phosphate isomerase/epimerase